MVNQPHQQCSHSSPALAGPLARYVGENTGQYMLISALHKSLMQVLENDGSLLACALNAASTALTDAAVPMTSIIGVLPPHMSTHRQ